MRCWICGFEVPAEPEVLHVSRVRGHAREHERDSVVVSETLEAVGKWEALQWDRVAALVRRRDG